MNLTTALDITIMLISLSDAGSHMKTKPEQSLSEFTNVILDTKFVYNTSFEKVRQHLAINEINSLTVNVSMTLHTCTSSVPLQQQRPNCCTSFDLLMHICSLHVLLVTRR